MRALLALFERRYWGPRTKRRNAHHHRPAYPTTHAAVVARKRDPR